MADEEAVRALSGLGFTGLEAEVYAYLLRESPATGYRVAQALGKPVAGIYKTIESLTNKGAVMVDDGKNRLCRAVPSEELLDRLEHTFRERKAAAERALAEMPGATEDDRVYQLGSLDQVMTRCRAMLLRAERLVVIDAFPGALAELQPEIEAAGARGARLAVMAYEPIRIEGARVSLFPQSHPLMEGFPAEYLVLDVDGSELLLAFLSRGDHGLYQAIWSGSPFLAWTLHAYMMSELNYVCTLNDSETPPATRVVAERHRRYCPADIPGYHRLLRRLGLPDDPAPSWPE